MTNVLDLKHTPPEEEPDHVVDEASEEASPSAFTSPVEQVFAERIGWEASSRPGAIERKKEHFMLGGLGLLGVAVAFFTSNLFLVAVVIMAVFAWEMHHHFGHHDITVAVDTRGVSLNGHLYPHARLESFSVQQLPDQTWHMSVKQQGSMRPTLRAPLGETDHEEVRAVLSQYLVEEDHPIPISEIFLKS